VTTLLPGSPTTNLRRNPSAPWRHVDWVLIGATLAVALLGIVMVFSATRSTLGQPGTSTTYLIRQTVFVLIGIALAFVVTMIDYRHHQQLAIVFYGGALLLLVAVLSPLGTIVNGARSWFALGSFQIQPAEFAKLAVILLLAVVCSNARGGVMTVRSTFSVLVVTGIPVGLILLQPDLGSVMVFIAVAVTVLVVAGAPARHLIVLALIAVVGVIAVFQLGLLGQHQQDRLSNFVNPGPADSGVAYNSQQAQTAIGAGGLTGAGLFKGTQTELRYVPYQQSDFIFTVVGEELGFLGGLTLLALYSVMAWRIWRAALLSRDFFGTIVCAGVLGLLLFQVFENMGMTMGIMPITGIPLPLMSYGGSSVLTMFIAVGLVLNVHSRRFA
jgi:rod shape determining protein RodA